MTNVRYDVVLLFYRTLEVLVLDMLAKGFPRRAIRVKLDAQALSGRGSVISNFFYNNANNYIVRDLLLLQVGIV